MLVIYDLDKTSLFCPIADFLDRFIPRNKVLKKLYYNIYPFVHILEMKLGLLKINKEMYIRARQYDEFTDCFQVVITSRHRSFSLQKHIKAVFGDEIDINVFAIAQGLTNIHKVDIIDQLPINDDEEIIMYDDNDKELRRARAKYKGRFTGINVEYTGKEEKILDYVY